MRKKTESNLSKRLNEQVKRNQERFPEDLMFRLTSQERNEVVANCDHLQRLKFSPVLPYVFTEYGALMLANVLRSKTAVQMSIQIVRTFVKLRSLLNSHAELQKKIDSLESKYDLQFKAVFDAIRKLMTTEEKPKRKIGFLHVE